MLTDTHSHIYAEEFDSDRDEVIARAESVGVGLILLPAIDNESYDRQETLAMARPDLFRQMMGLHPTSVGTDYMSSLSVAKAKLYDKPQKYIGVGEIGLDFYWDTKFRDEQIEALETQFMWAEDLKKPVVLHLRSSKDGNADNDAYATIFSILEKHPLVHGIMHCFSGTLNDAHRAISMGFLIGIGGTVTYKKSTLPDIVRDIPLESIVLETDAPYLAPVPHRGKRNETAYVSLVAEKVAEIKGVSPDEVANITTGNAKKMFFGD